MYKIVREELRVSGTRSGSYTLAVEEQMTKERENMEEGKRVRDGAL